MLDISMLSFVLQTGQLTLISVLPVDESFVNFK